MYKPLLGPDGKPFPGQRAKCDGCNLEFPAELAAAHPAVCYYMQLMGFNFQAFGGALETVHQRVQALEQKISGQVHMQGKRHR